MRRLAITAALVLVLLVSVSTTLAAADELDPGGGNGGGTGVTVNYSATLKGERSQILKLKNPAATVFMKISIYEVTLKYSRLAPDGEFAFTSYKVKFSASWNGTKPVLFGGLALHYKLEWGDEAIGHSYELDVGELLNGEVETVSGTMNDVVSGAWPIPHFHIQLVCWDTNGYRYYLELGFKLMSYWLDWAKYFDAFWADNWILTLQASDPWADMWVYSLWKG